MNASLLYVGIAIAGASVIVGIVVTVIMWVSKRRINAKLEAEYGKRK